MQTATFGAGCFWCVEAVFELFKGVVSVEPGYMGGTSSNPTYEDVCSGATEHAEVAQIQFDPTTISFETLADIFWHAHDPTTRNRQGNDVGSQYRSVLFYHSEEQHKAATKLKQELNQSGEFESPIVTDIEPATTFWPAENYHKKYFAKNGMEPYCSLIIRPKVQHVREKYSELLKK